MLTEYAVEDLRAEVKMLQEQMKTVLAAFRAHTHRYSSADLKHSTYLETETPAAKSSDGKLDGIAIQLGSK